jgi:hypothetical protein
MIVEIDHSREGAMKATKTCISIILALAALTILSACGGGGGGGGTGNLPVITYSIMGIVSGAPQGTKVTLSGSAAATTTTNSIGFYQFTGLSSSGSYLVTASLSGYTFSPATRSVMIVNANATNQDFTVIDTYGIAGSATLANGTGVSDVTITLVHSSGASTTRTTDVNGNYSALDLAAGEYTISAGKGGYAMNPFNQKTTVTCDVRTDIDFTATFGATYSIMGSVSSLTYIVPDDITMTLSGDNSGYVLSSPGGTYTITGLANGTYTVRPSKFSYIFSSSCTTTINNANSTCDFTIIDKKSFPAAMPPPNCLDISGTITGPANNGSTMSILYRSYTLTTSVTSGIDGTYLRSVPSGSYVITPSNNGYTFSPPRFCGADFSCNSGATTTVIHNFTSQ